jgi:hypothetical protein
MQELKMYLWDEETGGVGGAEHVDKKLVSQHVQLLHLLPLYMRFSQKKHSRMHVKNCKNSEWLQEKLQESRRAGCSSLEGKRFGGKKEGWSTTPESSSHRKQESKNSSAEYRIL